MTGRDPIRVEIFDPPMCCPTGLCGPTIDPALLDIQEAVMKLSNEFEGRASFARYLPGQFPSKFMQHREVFGRLKASGIKALPVTVVKGRVVKEGAYPTYAELKGWIEEA
jgi:hypothetical protein